MTAAVPTTSPPPPSRTRRFWNALGSPNALRIGIFAVLAYRLWLYVMVGRWAKLRGDEVFYWRSAKQLLRLVNLEERGAASNGAIVDAIVSRGWFVPGMSGLLSPLRLFSQENYVGRAWVGLLSIILLLWLTRRIRQMYSPQAALIVLVVIGVLPYTAWFSFAFWGGHIGGLVMVLNLLYVIRLCRRIRVGIDPGWTPFLLLGISVVLSVYIRPTTLGQVLPMAALLFAAYSTHDGFFVAVRKSFLRWMVMFAVFMMLFAPWSGLLMKKFDGPFFVVTSRPLAQVMRTAPDSEIERVGTSFGLWYEEMQRLGVERDQGYYTVVTTERDRYAQTRSRTEVLQQVSKAMRRFYDLENQFLKSAIDSAEKSDRAYLDNQAEQRFEDRYLRFNSYAWLALTLAVLWALFRRWQFWEADGWLGIVLRTAMVMGLFQPITGGPHGRHISFLVPLFVVSVALAIDSHMRSDELEVPDSRWPRLEPIAGTLFSLMIGAFLAFYMST